VTELKGKVALVTGGGAGLGAAICENLAAAGATVVAADLRGERTQEVVAGIERRGGTGRAVHLDVGDPLAAENAVSQIVEQYGRLDVLVNNAGTDVTLPADELSVAQWECIVRTNLSGPFFLCRSALPVMKRQGAGHIVNIVSTAAKRAWPNASAYHASKWGLLGFSHALHSEARPLGVKVTAVICGGMRTGFLLDRFPEIDQGTLQDPRNVADVVRSVLLQPAETVIPEVMVLPMRETSWP
jgi:NAD(P)-dependent dehydrogenase (short-subunit alcohol dehydrogenase family)